MTQKLFGHPAQNRMQSCIPFSLLLLGLVLQVSGQAQQRILLALSKSDHTLAMVDPANFTVIAKMPVGQDPHEVIASSDGKLAFVSIYGGGSLHELDVLDLVAHKALPSVDTRPLFGPHGLTYAGGKVWFSAEGSKAVGRYDPAANKVDWSMGTGQNRTHMIYVTDDLKKIYTTNVSSGTVSILESTLVQPGGPPPGAPPANPSASTPPPPPPGMQPHWDWTQTVVAVGRGSEGFDVTPDGKQLWTAASDDGNVYMVDLVAKKLIGKIDAKAQGANRLEFTPDGKRALISSLRQGDLIVIDVANQAVIKRIPIGHGAAGILVDPDGSRAFVGCTGDNYVAVVDLNSMQMVNKINVGGGPDGLAWAVKPQ
ncbi:MAG TPA: hypothetical protein VMI35_15365 [Puia sp.]|nr:hypothetical protein [Puia sp.]